MSLTAEVLQKVDAVTLHYTAQVYYAIVSRYSTEIRLALVLYIAGYGFGVLQGRVSVTLAEASQHLLKICIVFTLATQWSWFIRFFYDVFTSGPDHLTSTLVGGINPSEQLGAIFDLGIATTASIFREATSLNIGLMIMGALVALGTLLMTGYVLFLLVLSKLSLAILLALAPLFLIFALWKSTQGLFQSWIHQLINYALIPVLTYALLALILTILQDSMKQIYEAGEKVKMYDVVPFLLIGCIACLLFAQVNRIAAALSHGVALSTLGSFSRYVNRPAANLAKRAGSEVIRSVEQISNWRQGNKSSGTPSGKSVAYTNSYPSSFQKSISVSSSSASQTSQSNPLSEMNKPIPIDKVKRK